MGFAGRAIVPLRKTDSAPSRRLEALVPDRTSTDFFEFSLYLPQVSPPVF